VKADLRRLPIALGEFGKRIAISRPLPLSQAFGSRIHIDVRTEPSRFRLVAKRTWSSSPVDAGRADIRSSMMLRTVMTRPSRESENATDHRKSSQVAEPVGSAR
jgi:nitric oxide reductase activation protein